MNGINITSPGKNPVSSIPQFLAEERAINANLSHQNELLRAHLAEYEAYGRDWNRKEVGDMWRRFNQRLHSLPEKLKAMEKGVVNLTQRLDHLRKSVRACSERLKSLKRFEDDELQSIINKWVENHQETVVHGKCNGSGA
jgi:biotin-(acetyl-CoA carboxylase) ligase